MISNHVKDQLLAYLCGELDTEQQRAINEHLPTCDACRKELETINAFWSSLNLLPQEQPSDAMREKFYESLQDAVEETAHRSRSDVKMKSAAGWFERLFPKPFAVQFGLGLLLLAIGGVVGLQLRQQPQQQRVQQQAQVQPVNTTEISQMHQELMAMNRLLTMSLLQQESASERLKGVSLSYRVEGSDPEITSALLQALKYDPNVNVRLAALDAIIKDKDHASIQSELVKLLPAQSSPLVQLEIVDWLMQKHEITSLDVLNRMLKNPEVNKAVKQRIEKVIQELKS